MPSFLFNSLTYFYWLPLKLEIILRKNGLYVKLPLIALAKFYKVCLKFLLFFFSFFSFLFLLFFFFFLLYHYFNYMSNSYFLGYKNSTDILNMNSFSSYLTQPPPHLFFGFLGLHLRHIEVPKLGVESELQLPTPEPQQRGIQAVFCIVFFFSVTTLGLDGQLL